MPSGRTHDRITLLSLGPTALIAWALTHEPTLSALVVGATLFGGVMFGPDLDTASRQYRRWGPFRFIWWPYRVAFAHRSRWSHGLLFGAIIRVFYFTGMVVLLAFTALYLHSVLFAGKASNLSDLLHAWQLLADHVDARLDRRAIWAAFIGLWWGAALHTLLDVLCSIGRRLLDLF